jgi:hypothetical protein
MELANVFTSPFVGFVFARIMRIYWMIICRLESKTVEVNTHILFNSYCRIFFFVCRSCQNFYKCNYLNLITKI